jgi:hypothetical protein
MEIKYDIELTREERRDLFTTALEGGINYWARRGAVKTSDSNIETVLYIDGQDAEDYEVNPTYLIEGTAGKVEIDDWVMQFGLDRLVKSPYQHHVTDIINDNADATTADVIVQMALFGDIIYG